VSLIKELEVMLDMAKITVWRCSEHGETELIDFKEPLAYCPNCGRQMEKVGEYEE